MKKIIVFLAFVFTLISCNNSIDNSETTSIKEENETKVEKLQVITSIIPLASITNYIGGDFVKTKSLVPAGVSPHGFDIKPNQMVDIENSDLIVYLGLDHVDGFLDKALEGKNELIASAGIQLMETSEEHEHHDEHEDEDEHEDDEHHEDDPHVWTSSLNALIIAENIRNELTELDAENKDYYESNYSSFKNKLTEVKQSFLDNTSGKNQKEFIVFHDAYNYLFKELNINSEKKLIFQKNVLSDPHSTEMKKLIDEINIHGVNTAFREPQLNDNNLKQLALEYSLEIHILDPLGTNETSSGYIENYKDNLRAIGTIYE